MSDTVLLPAPLDGAALDWLRAAGAAGTRFDRADVTLHIGGEAVRLSLGADAALSLSRLLVALSDGCVVHLAPLDEDLTTQDVADLVGASRPFVVQQIEAGRLPARKVGTHRRVALRDALAFRDAMHARQPAALADLSELSQSLGLYDEAP